MKSAEFLLYVFYETVIRNTKLNWPDIFNKAEFFGCVVSRVATDQAKKNSNSVLKFS